MSRNSKRTSRRVVIAAAAMGATALSVVPALADSGTGIPVTVATSAGSRQFAVETVTGSSLTALNLGQNGSAPFRVRVTDSAFNPGTANPFVVSAVMNNLYQQNAGGTGYAYNVSIPSSDASISFPATPLAETGVSIPFDPTLSINGLLPTCSQLNNLLGSSASLPLGSNPITGIVGAVTGTVLAPTDPLCAALGGALSIVPTNVTTPAAVTTTLQKTLSDVLSTLGVSDLPINLANVPTGSNAFTNPDYTSGSIGAGDTGKPSSPAAATPVTLLSGNENVTANLQSIITSAYAGIPLIGTTGTPGLATADAVIAALRTTATGQLATILTQLSQSTNTQAVADTLNALTTKLSAASITNILNLTGSYLSFPSINVITPTSTPAGSYQGTMTVTYVQK